MLLLSQKQNKTTLNPTLSTTNYDSTPTSGQINAVKHGNGAKNHHPTNPERKNLHSTISAQAKSWIAMLGFAFSSTILCEANTQGLSGLGKYQDYRSTLQTSNKHVPILCTRMAVTIYWNSLQSGLGPGFSHSLKIGILCTLSFYSQTALQVWRQRQDFLGHELLAGCSQLFLCT